MSQRATYTETGAAIRQAHERALAQAKDLTERDWRVLLALVALIASWSRLEDRLTAAQVAAAAGTDERAAQRCLSKLRDLGIITREATRGRRPAMTGLPAAQPRSEETGVPAAQPRSEETGVPAAQPRSEETGVAGDEPRSLPTPNPGLQGPPTREDFRGESSAPARASQRAPAGSAGGRPAQAAEEVISFEEWAERAGDQVPPVVRSIIDRHHRKARQLELAVEAGRGDELARRDARRRTGESGSGATARPTGPPGETEMRPSAGVASTGGPA